MMVTTENEAYTAKWSRKRSFLKCVTLFPHHSSRSPIHLLFLLTIATYRIVGWKARKKDEILFTILMIQRNEKCFVLCCPQTNRFSMCAQKAVGLRGKATRSRVKSAANDIRRRWKCMKNMRENQFCFKVNQRIKRNLIKQKKNGESWVVEVEEGRAGESWRVRERNIENKTTIKVSFRCCAIEIVPLVVWTSRWRLWMKVSEWRCIRKWNEKKGNDKGERYTQRFMVCWWQGWGIERSLYRKLTTTFLGT